MSSVRDYAILWVGARAGVGGGSTSLGGNALLRTPQHKLDGPEHLAPDDTTTLDVSVDRHGLAPKLDGDPTHALRGDGTYGRVGGFVPTFIAADDTFVVPDDSQALFAMTIDVEGTLEVDGYLIEVD